MIAHPENLISSRKAGIRKTRFFCSLESKSQIGKYSHNTGAICNTTNKSSVLVTGQMYSLTKHIYFYRWQVRLLWATWIAKGKQGRCFSQIIPSQTGWHYQTPPKNPVLKSMPTIQSQRNRWIWLFQSWYSLQYKLFGYLIESSSHPLPCYSQLLSSQENLFLTLSEQENSFSLLRTHAEPWSDLEGAGAASPLADLA